MSVSDLSEPANAPLPADAELEAALRRVVRTALKRDEEITINTARKQVEEELDLDAGFFKDDAKWKVKSKDIISAAVEEPQSPENPKKNEPKKSAPKRAKAAKPTPKVGTKRKSDEPQPPKKRRKPAKAADSEEDEDDEIKDEDEDEAPKPKAARNGTRSRQPVKDEEDEDQASEPAAPEAKGEDDGNETSALSDPPPDVSEADAPKVNGSKTAEADDESDFSSVIDEPPPKKKGRQKKSTSPTESKTKSKKTTTTAKPAAKAKELSPDDEEVKRLQGWLVKCGIRKLWHRELVHCDTAKAKIKHLKAMLEDVGMTGRYSAEKARQIKESRELAAELEAAKEFNDQWGQKGSGEESEDGEGEGGAEEKVEEKDDAPARRARPKGFVDFGDSGDDASD